MPNSSPDDGVGPSSHWYRGRVVIQQRDLDYGAMDDMQGLEHLVVAPVALNGSNSFRAASDGVNDAVTSQPKEDGEQVASLSDTSGSVHLLATSMWISMMGLSVLVAMY
ncbi:hypothetical protein QTG54_006800 [Skeletonema marinoi]|uniref:Uncharacterized protein n=1 Tax=Skeletonema marinoi TaxID=267567 RepID=A0AAD8YBW4_9STRA|nr:hypothetical protein QTG54_006800 [Skeletonema marinoi]